jgi:SSS family transporter
MAALLRPRRLLSAVTALAALALSLGCAAEGVSAVNKRALPDLSGNPGLSGLVAIDGRPVALQSGEVRIFDRERKAWIQARSPQPNLEAAAGFASDGRLAFALMRDEQSGAIARTARMILNDDALELRASPEFPIPLSSAVAAPMNDTVYVAGNDANGVPRLLQLSSLDSRGEWIERAAWPGDGTPTSLVAQARALYVTVQESGTSATQLLRWSSKDGWQDVGASPGPILPGSARAIGQAHILYLVREPDGASHLASFHTISRAWAELDFGSEGRVIGATALDNGLLTATQHDGRIAVEDAQLVSAKRPLTLLDWSIVVVYLAGMIGVGVYWYVRDRKMSSTSEFFVGSRAIPFWAAGVSLFATNTSSISYLAIPAKAFETDWQYMMNKIMTVLGLMFVAVWIVPLLRRLDLVSVFNYLEIRFNPVIRMIGSALCMMMHVGGRMSVVLFLPALAIATITGIDVVWSILIMGVCTIVYTALGGMRAVVWTDFVQVIVLMGGALFAIGFVLHSLGGTAIVDTAMAFDKTKLVNFSFDLTEPTVWGFFFLILFDVVLSFPKDQVLMQRTLATKSAKEAGRSIWMFAAIMLPGGFIFYVIGTVLFAYYKEHPDRLDPLLPIDATFPLFISAELPAGLTGLIIAGLFAAAMGTLSGTINSVATLLSVDFYEKLAKNPTQEKSLRFAEWMTVVIGLVGIGLALLLSRYDIHSLLDLTIELAGLLGGGFAGAYTLGMFTRRANSAGVSIGVGTAIVVTFLAWWNDLVHPYFYLGISIFVCIVVGYLASLFFPAPERSLAGLTIYRDQ